MPAVTLTFEDQNDPLQGNVVRTYLDDTTVVCTDNGEHPVSAVIVGWKIKRHDEPWLIVFAVA